MVYTFCFGKFAKLAAFDKEKINRLEWADGHLKVVIQTTAEWRKSSEDLEAHGPKFEKEKKI